MPRTHYGWKDLLWYFSALTKEATYGAAEAVDTKFRLNTSPPRLIKSKIPDLDLQGGTEEVGSYDLLDQHVRFTVGMPYATPHFLAFIVGYGLGAVTTSTPEVGQTARLHEFSPKTSDNLLPTFTAEVVHATGVQKQYVGCYVDSYTIRVTKGGWVEATAEIIGKSMATGSGSASAISEAFLGAKDCAAFYSTGAYDGSMSQDKSTSDLGSAVASKAISQEFEWTVNNNSDPKDNEEFDSGGLMARAERSRRTQTYRLQHEYMEDDVLLGYYENDTVVRHELECHGSVLAGDAVGTYFGFNLIFPNLEILEIDWPEALGKQMIAASFGVKEDATYGSVKFGVINAQTGYLQ